MSLEVERLLNAHLTKLYGVGTVPDRLVEIGMSGPAPALAWKDEETTIFLGHNRNFAEPAGIREGVLLVAVRQPVLTERSLKINLEKSFATSALLAQPVMAADLSKDLGTSYVAIAKPPANELERAESQHIVRRPRC